MKKVMFLVLFAIFTLYINKNMSKENAQFYIETIEEQSNIPISDIYFLIK